MTDSGPRPGAAADWRHARTDRLWLDLPVAEDVDDLWAIHGDPASWTHFPQGRHPDRSVTREKLAAWLGWWAHDDLGFWSVRADPAGPVIGCGGCTTGEGWPWWNLYYRFATSVQGRGYAVEMGRAALTAAQAVRPELPVIAFLLEHNVASRRTAERLGLGLVWQGPDLGNDDPEAVRLVFCDRDAGPGFASALEQKFRPR